MAGNVREPIEGNLQLYAPATYIYMQHAINITEQRAYTKTSNYKLDTTSPQHICLSSQPTHPMLGKSGAGHTILVSVILSGLVTAKICGTQEYVKISIMDGQFSDNLLHCIPESAVNLQRVLDESAVLDKPLPIRAISKVESMHTLLGCTTKISIQISAMIWNRNGISKYAHDKITSLKYFHSLAR